MAELLAIGARHIDIGQDPSDTHVVLADPEGNEFCIIEPQNRFLAGCPRLGRSTATAHALGCFWSEAVGWPLVWDQDDETAIQAADGSGPKITWSGRPLMPKLGDEQFHFHVAPTPGTRAGPRSITYSRSAPPVSTSATHAPLRSCWPMSTAMSSASSSRRMAPSPVPDLHS